MQTMLATCEASPNNALVKYWGKRDEKLFLPMNSSVSVAMDEQLTTRATVAFSNEFKRDEAWLDGEKASGEMLGEFMRVLDLVRARAKKSLRTHAASQNNFPAAAGLASSASGAAALVIAASNALGLELSTRELSMIARQGSGSACRSVLGGFVEWKRGVQRDGRDSFAAQVAPPEHWPEFKCVIAIVEKERKKVSSREGMKQTLATSTLFKQRLQDVSQRVEECKKLIFEKKAQELFELIMRDSMSMHACMLDTFPPIIYLNEASKHIINAVHEYNESVGEVACGYSFDAGPNAHVYCLEKNVWEIRKMLSQIEGVQQIIASAVGRGPKLVQKHLLNEEGELQ